MSKKLNKREISTILFALRYLQSNYDDSFIEESVHFDEGTKPLTEKEIDNLCENINTEDFCG